MTYGSSPSAAYTALNGSVQWTVECIVYPLISTTPTEQYFFDPRNGHQSGGMVFGMNYVSGVWRPSTWATGDTSVIGVGSSTKPATSGPTIIGSTWNHIAWVKRATDASNIYIYLNGVSCGTVICGTIATTDSAWNAITIVIRISSNVLELLME
jgi:hypothetical protein